MHICFITSRFPHGKEAVFTFVKEYVDALADLGVECTVISPQSVTRVMMGRARLRPQHWNYLTASGKIVEVYQPYYISLSNHLEQKRRQLMSRAIEKTLSILKKTKKPIDAFYSHFWSMGITIAGLAGDTPVFLACGESKINAAKLFTYPDVELRLKKISGVVYVSGKSLEEAKRCNLQRDMPYIIAPNGYNPKVFYKRDKMNVRRALGLPEDTFIVAYVGSFIPRKGTRRLAAALDELNCGIHSIFIGSGEDTPQCKNILFCGPLAHDQICDYLAAADIFVLPTNNEGCCNAIIEALACGLPIVSSNKSFNDDILDENCSIRVDEMDVSAIAEAIGCLYADRQLLERMSQGALEKAKQLTIGERGEKILQFLTDNISVQEK